MGQKHSNLFRYLKTHQNIPRLYCLIRCYLISYGTKKAQIFVKISKNTSKYTQVLLLNKVLFNFLWDKNSSLCKIYKNTSKYTQVVLLNKVWFNFLWDKKKLKYFVKCVNTHQNIPQIVLLNNVLLISYGTKKAQILVKYVKTHQNVPRSFCLIKCYLISYGTKKAKIA